MVQLGSQRLPLTKAQAVADTNIAETQRSIDEITSYLDNRTNEQAAIIAFLDHLRKHQ